MSWDLNSYAQQAEGEIWDSIVENERDSVLATETDAHLEWHRNSGVPLGTPGCPQDACHLDEPDDRCDSCGARAELFHNERTGLSFCEACDLASEVQPVRFKRLRSGAWGLSGPASYLREGEQVVVEKRGGTRDTVRVGRVLWADNAQNKAIATIAR